MPQANAFVIIMAFVCGIICAGIFRRRPYTREEMFNILVQDRIEQMDKEDAKQSLTIDFQKEIQKRRRKR